MTRIAWVVHNNATNMVRLLIEGMRELGRTDIEHVASREDTIYLREPDLRNVRDREKIGEFPDSTKFIPVLASGDFWKNLRFCDFIVFTVNCGANHNAYRAAEIIRRYNLFSKTIYLDEDESGFLHPDFRDMFLKARLAFVWRPSLYQQFRVHPYVVNLGFNGVESRYLGYAKPMKAKKTSVFFRGRVVDRPQRLPFIEALRSRDYSDACIMPELRGNTDPRDLVWQHVTGNRHNASYYEHLADSKVCVILHGGNPVGYQFWECAALECSIVTQDAKPTDWYGGGSYPTKLLDYEQYDPPFERGRHFLTFTSPDEMLEKIDYLLVHDGFRQEIALACHHLALEHYTSRARARKFLEYLFREP